MNGEGAQQAVPARLPAGLVPAPDDPRLQGLVDALRGAGGGAIRAVLLYGSHVQASEPDRFSAHDLIVVVDGYREFYRALDDSGLLRRPPWLITAWSHVLLPTSISFDPCREDQAVGKCQIVTAEQLRRALGPRSRDHFLKGRTVQRLALAWARDEVERASVLESLNTAREDTARWVRPYLEAPFTEEDYARRMLGVSYAAEIRPESGTRVGEVFDAQRETLLAIARQAVEAGLERGVIVRAGEAYTWAKPPNGWARLSTGSYFAKSKIRATARWIKHVVTFVDWPLYIVRKLERRAGLQVRVTDKERRWPFIYLWPKLFRVLRELRRNRDRSGGESTA